MARNRAKLLSQSRSTARKKGVPHRLSLEDVHGLDKAQKGRCALTGLEFTAERIGGTFVPYPFSPSLDRIEPSRGYVPGNVQLVCTAPKFARGQWGDTVLRRIALGIVETEQRVEAKWYRDMRRRIRKAEAQRKGLSGEARKTLEHRIAGLKAALTKGPARLTGAGSKAALARRESGMAEGNVTDAFFEPMTDAELEAWDR